MKITDRILTAIRPHHGVMDYHALMREVFPENKYPRAWRPSCNGGPPGCAMAFGAALRRLGAWQGPSQRMNLHRAVVIDLGKYKTAVQIKNKALADGLLADKTKKPIREDYLRRIAQKPLYKTGDSDDQALVRD